MTEKASFVEDCCVSHYLLCPTKAFWHVHSTECTITLSSVALTVIKQELKIKLRIKNLQAIHSIFKLQAHVVVIPVLFVVGSNI